MEEEIGNEISSQEALFHEIKGNIDVAQMVLAELKRENRTLASQDGPGGAGTTKKPHSNKDQGGSVVDQMDVDIDFLMEDIRKEITRIHTVCCEGPGMDGPGLKAKPTIDIL